MHKPIHTLSVSKPVCVWTAQALLGEGTLWSVNKQQLYWVDILGHAMHAYDPLQRQKTTWQLSQEITAVAECSHTDQLLVTLKHAFAYFDLTTQALTVLHQPENEIATNRFNDGKCDVHGKFWAGTMDAQGLQPTGHFYRFHANGSCTHVPCGFQVTNGPAFTPDGQSMYLNDTVGGRVLRCQLNRHGDVVGAPEHWLRFDTSDGFPDGMTVDKDGRVWIAHWGGGCVTCHDPHTTHELARITLPCSQVTNCCFGGAQLQTLFITTASVGLSPSQIQEQPLAGAVFSVETTCQGLPSPLFTP